MGNVFPSSAAVTLGANNSWRPLKQTSLYKRHGNSRPAVLAALALVILFTAGGVPKAAASASLEDFFKGHFRGTGVEKDQQHAAVRGVTFQGTGTPIAGGLRFGFDVVFSDGERVHKVWTFMKVAEGHYIGRRADVIGNADVTQAGNDIHLTYKARVATKGGSFNVNFDENFIRTGPRSLVNRLTASYLFLNVGSAEISYQKFGSDLRRRTF